MISSNFGGKSGFTRDAGAGSRSRIALKIMPEVFPVKAWRPVAISYSTRPNENKSVRPSNFSPRTCSGDMYATVPSAVPGLVRFASASIVSPPMLTASLVSAGISFARPKSSTFAWPRSVMKIFAGLMSRCTMPPVCAASSASATSIPVSSSISKPSGPLVMRCFNVAPRSSSIAMNGVPSSSSIS